MSGVQSKNKRGVWVSVSCREPQTGTVSGGWGVVMHIGKAGEKPSMGIAEWLQVGPEVF